MWMRRRVESGHHMPRKVKDCRPCLQSCREERNRVCASLRPPGPGQPACRAAELQNTVLSQPHAGCRTQPSTAGAARASAKSSPGGAACSPSGRSADGACLLRQASPWHGVCSVRHRCGPGSRGLIIPRKELALIKVYREDRGKHSRQRLRRDAGGHLTGQARRSLRASQQF